MEEAGSHTFPQLPQKLLCRQVGIDDNDVDHAQDNTAGITWTWMQQARRFIPHLEKTSCAWANFSSCLELSFVCWVDLKNEVLAGEMDRFLKCLLLKQ